MQPQRLELYTPDRRATLQHQLLPPAQLRASYDYKNMQKHRSSSEGGKQQATTTFVKHNKRLHSILRTPIRCGVTSIVGTKIVPEDELHCPHNLVIRHTEHSIFDELLNYRPWDLQHATKCTSLNSEQNAMPTGRHTLHSASC